jgi:hypothetical protein
MASRIENIIPKQGFEIIRDLISAIITTELINQQSLQDLKDPLNIYTGRSVPFAHSEQLMINCVVDSGDYSNNHQKGTHGKTNYFVDIYTSAVETQDNDGGFLATQKRDKYLGMIRYILQDHHYVSLGLPSGLIMGKSVDGFENFEVGNHQDATFTKMSRLSFSVRIIEDQSLWAGVDISSIFTEIKLESSENGYKYEKIIN